MVVVIFDARTQTPSEAEIPIARTTTEKPRRMSDTAAPQRSLHRTLILSLFILATALALLSGHALERAHEVSLNAPQTGSVSSSVLQSSSDTVLATAGQLLGSPEQGGLDRGIAGLCTFVVTTCIALLTAIVLFGQMRRVLVSASIRALIRPFIIVDAGIPAGTSSFDSRSALLRI